MSKILVKIMEKINPKKSDINEQSCISTRSKKFQDRVDEIFDRLDNNPHKEDLDKLETLLECSKSGIKTLKENIPEIDRLMLKLTDVYESHIGVDSLFCVELDRHRFTYGTLIVNLMHELEKSVLSISKTKKRDKHEKMLVMSFVDYSSRFNNKHARLTDEDSERYVRLTSKYADYSASDMIPREFKG